MRHSEVGTSALELVVAAFLGAVIVGGGIGALNYVIHNNQASSEHLSAVYYAEIAGQWLTRDAMTAGSITTDNLTGDAVVEMKWTTWNDAGDTVYHVVTYSITDLSGGVGKLTRRYQDSLGTDGVAIILDRIYYNTGDPAGSTALAYTAPVLQVRVAAQVGQARAVRDYRVSGRPDF